MNRVGVVSSMMASVGHDPSCAILEIEFKSGALYQYVDVPRDRYDALLAAASKGRYFNSHLRNAFTHRRPT